ncbi:C40 family peptidase [Demequina aurantiaca]|uniref:C40 family peptidase n=1 Tax=Demequina aurantiaca TaxID=676200 RepID=UPI003D328284
MTAAVGAAIIVVPLTGAAAAALVATEPDTTTIQVSATSTLSFADAVAPVQADLPTPIEADEVPAVDSADVSEVPAVVAASDDVELTLNTPDLKVKKNPAPVVVAPTTTSTTTSRSTTTSARPVANSASVSAAISGSAIIAEAAKYVGTPYQRGGSSPSAFDCSGFISYVYGKFGISLPHSSAAYYSVGTRVSSPQVGDIIVTPGHVGIYAGPNLQIDASTYGTPVRFHSIWQNNPVYVRVS